MTAERVPLHYPHCLKSSCRPLRFVQAKSSFVCNYCREVVPIDKAGASRTLARLATAGRAGLGVATRPFHESAIPESSAPARGAPRGQRGSHAP